MVVIEKDGKIKEKNGGKRGLYIDIRRKNSNSLKNKDGQYRYSYSYDVLSTSLLAPRQGSKELKPRVRKHAFGPMSLRERRVARK